MTTKGLPDPTAYRINRRTIRPLVRPDHACQGCKLHEQAQTPCIPTDCRWRGPDGTDQAVLIVGEAPGAQEDVAGAAFVGAAGEKLESFFVGGAHLDQLADVYLANAVRCRPPENRTPHRAEARTCCDRHLRLEIDLLREKYRVLLVLCVGATATTTVTEFKSLSEMFGNQDWTHPAGPNVHVFATYHPAALLRNANWESPAASHLMMVWEFLLRGKLTVEEPPPVVRCPAPLPAAVLTEVSMDIETKGVLCTHEQKTFHPMKMRYLEGLPYDDQIVCVSIAYHVKGEEGINSGIFIWNDPTDRAFLRRWMEDAPAIVGQHLQFDLKFLRACDSRLRQILRPWKPLVDLLVESFLYDDLAPERGLKAIAALYRVHRYDQQQRTIVKYKDPVTGKARHRGAYKDENDPKLHEYCCYDSWATLRCVEIARNYTKDKYGTHPTASSKLSGYRRRWFSNQIWAAILMEEAGIAMDLQALRVVDDNLQHQLKALAAEAGNRQIVAVGKGSLTSKQAEIAHAADIALAAPVGEAEHTRIVQTVRTLKRSDAGVLSTEANNRNALIGLLPLRHPPAAQCAQNLALIREIASVQKLLTGYTGTLLRGRKVDTIPRKALHVQKNKKVKLRKVKGLDIIVYDRTTTALKVSTDNRDLGLAFPQWIIIPRSADFTGKGGGVRQFRWSAKDPSAQTLPPIIKACLTSRHDPGVLLCYDYSQIEWRTAAFLAQDHAMLGDIGNKVDIHSETALRLLSPEASGTLDLWVAWGFINTPRANAVLARCPDAKMREQHRLRGSEHKGLSEEAYLNLVIAWLRQNCGKSQNFAWLYGGMPPVIQSTTRVKSGIEIPIETCEAWFQWMLTRYPALADYRTRLLRQTVKDFAVHLPILGQSRSFAGDPDDIIWKNRPEILDMPIQTTASNILQAACVDTQIALRAKGLQADVVMNWHDAIIVDTHLRDIWEVHKAATKALRRTDYLTKLEAHVGAHFPLDLEATVLRTYPEDLHMVNIPNLLDKRETKKET